MSSRLSVPNGDGNPAWNEYFMFPLNADSQVVVISVWLKRKSSEAADEVIHRQLLYFGIERGYEEMLEIDRRGRRCIMYLLST